MPAEAEPPAHEHVPAASLADAEIAERVPRLRLIRWIFAGLLISLLLGLGYRQLFHSADFAARARAQEQRQLLVPAPRGIIRDRAGRILADNRLRLDVGLDLGRLRDVLRGESPTDGATAARARLAAAQRQLDRINAITGRRDPVDPARLERAYARERRAPFVLVEDLSGDEAKQLSATLTAADPLQLLRSSQRWYPLGRTAAHVLGRVRPARIRVTTDPSDPGNVAMSYPGTVGDSGIEKQYDARLQGRPGRSVLQVDAENFVVDPPQELRAPVPGEDLTLSLDLEIQRAAETALAAMPGAATGAAVVIAVTSGEVLALASLPNFDLNAVSPRMTAATKQEIDAEGGWFNRATQGLYPPGSTFKIFTALAGLRHGSLHPDDVLPCNGYYDVGSRRFPCHHPQGHGDLTLRSALPHSCNVFAYQVGLATGPDHLAAEARRFHLGEPTGIDLPGETRRMLVPDPIWKEKQGFGPWTPGDTANFAIGQGYLLCSPLQAACAMASLARRETLTVPTLLHQPGRRPTGDRAAEPLGLTDGNYRALIEGLQAVILTGIGREAQVPGLTMAGKTGTTQVHRQDGMHNIAWFVAFAPVENPQIAIAVALEGSRPGEEFAGGKYAAPVVREIAGAWYDKQLLNH